MDKEEEKKVPINLKKLNLKFGSQFVGKIIDSMEFAERFYKKQGFEKKEWVLNRMKHILDEKYPLYSSIIEEVIELIVLITKDRTFININNTIKKRCFNSCFQ